ILLTGLIFSFYSFAQDSTTSLAYKSTKPNKKPVPFYQPDLAYKIWQQFNLIREANAGDAFAQHELGLRYLLGDGVIADTLQGAVWIKKAADQNLTSAIFNYGILQLNGWGVQWNPFEAFKSFLIAAESGMAQAQHIVGLFYTDNLIVKRDWALAYKWVKKAAEKDYQPAKESLTEFINKIPVDQLDTSFTANKDLKNTGKDNSLVSSLGLVFIDFDVVSDTIKEVTDKMLLDDLLNPGNEIVSDSMLNGADSLSEINPDVIPLLLKLADNGSPEALAILGRMYEKGIHYKKDLIAASSYYVRAVKFDSPTSGKLLYDLCKENNFINQVQEFTKKDDPEASFVWYGITILGFNIRIAEQDALNLLVKSASQGYMPAINELGLNYYTGNLLSEDKEKALELWESAERINNPEAKTRIAAGNIFGEIKSEEISESIKSLTETSEDGSVLAQVALGYAYENGVGLEKSKSEAVKYFRYAAQRGNRFAFGELKRIYDEIRPDDSEFRVN
ncbi:MAG TPA: tetratricopeptide repeat protein, partial [Ignavibacteriaceae bacterium]|nr:tetratricopeptide repeat protein [Ignavibacteriaceae bacterium]